MSEAGYFQRCSEISNGCSWRISITLSVGACPGYRDWSVREDFISTNLRTENSSDSTGNLQFLFDTLILKPLVFATKKFYVCSRVKYFSRLLTA